MKRYERGMNPELTHVGYIAKIVPIYANEDCSAIEARNWFAEYMLDVVDFLLVNTGMEIEATITGLNKKLSNGEQK